MKVKAKNDTLFKLQPVLSSELADTEKRFVENGAEYDVKFFTEANHNHLRLELTKAALDNQNALTWYVRKADVEIVGSGVTATVLNDTLFKQQPLLSSELSDRDKIFIAAGREFELQSFLPAIANHTKLTLAEVQLGDQLSDTWYVSAADIEVSGQKITLKITSDTVFKARHTPLNRLSPSEKEFVSKHTSFDLQSYAEVEGNYLKVTLSGTALGEDGRITWYVYAPDVEIEGTEPNNYPQDANPAGRKETSSDRGQSLNLPGFQGTYYSHDPIIAGGYFTWAQATHSGTRIPASVDVVYGMIRIAETLEEIRTLFDNRPVEIVSWYRDPATNLRVGGSKTSRHISGDGVNFRIEGIHPHDVYSKLDAWWGNRGGLARSTEFTHIDARGYRARWDYGF
ncbi:D-Ala-D-Ala carboxypeptidase family metallohydrolase [Oscillatoria sp. CS-180]|uniref:D-Ala-D-Ala carboxypeptidase family metallohydrolase n=1 Tax=Oscillatoria sp. CS-180 TaxID=3021720 RepID=UPI00232F13DE|nr:D-Ala-D-Ala carboxypeptidase family metallohydrolase [Oscillatoria sp. CS-180]MDB9526408.1 D-Ala-D-Ala carboxypeptidase family metallohydrolase [Oscillatoria sp. CS-180]